MKKVFEVFAAVIGALINGKAIANQLNQIIEEEVIHQAI
jgi:hypothetical protein